MRATLKCLFPGGSRNGPTKKGPQKKKPDLHRNLSALMMRLLLLRVALLLWCIRGLLVIFSGRFFSRSLPASFCVKLDLCEVLPRTGGTTKPTKPVSLNRKWQFRNYLARNFRNPRGTALASLRDGRDNFFVVSNLPAQSCTRKVSNLYLYR